MKHSKGSESSPERLRQWLEPHHRPRNTRLRLLCASTPIIRTTRISSQNRSVCYSGSCGTSPTPPSPDEEQDEPATELERCDWCPEFCGCVIDLPRS